MSTISKIYRMGQLFLANRLAGQFKRKKNKSNRQSDWEMWEPRVFGTACLVCSVNRSRPLSVFSFSFFFFRGKCLYCWVWRPWLRARPKTSPGRLGQTTRWRSANIAVNSTSWSPWHQGRVCLEIPEPGVTLHFVQSILFCSGPTCSYIDVCNERIKKKKWGILV